MDKDVYYWLGRDFARTEIFHTNKIKKLNKKNTKMENFPKN